MRWYKLNKLKLFSFWRVLGKCHCLSNSITVIPMKWSPTTHLAPVIISRNPWMETLTINCSIPVINCYINFTQVCIGMVAPGTSRPALTFLLYLVVPYKSVRCSGVADWNYVSFLCWEGLVTLAAILVLELEHLHQQLYVGSESQDL